VSTVEELTTELRKLFDHHQERIRMGEAAQSMLRQNQGALQATIEAIDRQLAGVVDGRSAPCSPGSVPVVAGR
jgi:hypothetical protein